MALVQLLRLISSNSIRRKRLSACQGTGPEVMETRVLLSAAHGSVGKAVAGPLPDYSGKWNVDSVLDGVAILQQSGNIVTSTTMSSDGFFPGAGEVKGNGKLVWKGIAQIGGFPVSGKIVVKLTDIDTFEGKLKANVPFVGKVKAQLTGTRVNTP